MEKGCLYKIERRIYSYDDFERDYPVHCSRLNITKTIKNKLYNINFLFLKILRFICPFPFILKSYYRINYLLNDLIAGFTMLVLHIPQGLAYGLLSGLEPVNGLYTSFFAPIVYAFFGTSRHLSVGTFSLMALMSSIPVFRELKTDILNLTTNSSDEFTDFYSEAKLSISVSTTLLSGIFQIGLGVFQMGFITNFMSDSLVNGFTTAASFHVILSQLSHVLGYKVTKYSDVGELPYKLYLFCVNISKTNWITLILSLFCIVFLVIFQDYINPLIKKKLKFSFPIQFFLVVLTTVVSYFANLKHQFNIDIVGPIPNGLPKISIPDVAIWPRVVNDAALLAFLGLIINFALVKTFAIKFQYDVNYSQELFAYGLSNVVGSFFQCTVSSGALARTAVVVDVGMMSQIASLISCSAMMLVLLFVAPLFQYIPKCVLAVVIIVSLKGLLLQLSELPKLHEASKYDFYTWIGTFLATMILNLPFGIAFGFLCNQFTILMHLQHSKCQVLGQIPGTDIYKNLKKYKDAREICGLKMFRFNAPLYSGNAEKFQLKIYSKSGINPHKLLKPQQVKNPNVIEIKLKDCGDLEDDDNKIDETVTMANDLRLIIIDCGSMNYIDHVGVRILNEMYAAYLKLDVSLFLADVNHNVRNMLRHSNWNNLDQIMFVSLHDAVLAITNMNKQ